MPLDFTKLSGAGNDFIVIDNRNHSLKPEAQQIHTLCARGTGIGADGLILIEPSSRFDFSMRYYNADGFPGSMCGNGGRCAALFAYAIGIPSKEEGSYSFEANGNRYDATITGHEMVRLCMTDPTNFRDAINVEGFNCHYVDTGSPHVLVFVPAGELDGIDVRRTGSAIRHRTDLFAGGTNVNFIEVIAQDTISVRTFERGVEDETLACGTGAVAAAIVSYRFGRVSSSRIRVKVRSGDILEVSFKATERKSIGDVTLCGPAKIIYRGTTELPLGKKLSEKQQGITP